MYKIKWTRLQTEIFRLLCIKAGQILNLRGIARNLKVSPTAVSKALTELEKEELVVVKKSEIINLLAIEFNRNNPKAIQLKRAENLKMVYESGLSNFLYHEFPGCTIILFGSYSKGEDVYFGDEDERNSDLDLAVIGTKSRSVDLTKFNKLMERIISINCYKSWNDLHQHLKNNILNGILLSGGIDL